VISERRTIVFSDVEALLESPACVSEEVERVRGTVIARHVPVVLCSTRTRAELEFVQRRLGICHPFVCENGAAIYVPRGYFDFDLPNARAASGYQVVEFGRPYRDVVRALREHARRLEIDIVGFDDSSVEDVAHDCHVSLQQARLAKLREYGEPFRIVSRRPDQRTRLFRALAASGFGCAAGGRYEHVGAAADEASAIRLLCEWYGRAYGSVATIGLGDPVRDSGLLQAVEVPVLVRREDAEPPRHLIMKRPAARSPERPARPRAAAWRRVLTQLAGRVRRRVSRSVFARPDYHGVRS
jgi:mannosyl-3-phosphoglycerate phosphatase